MNRTEGLGQENEKQKQPTQGCWEEEAQGQGKLVLRQWGYGVVFHWKSDFV